MTHYLDDLAAARDRLQLPADSIIILDNVGFHRSPVEAPRKGRAAK